MNLKPKRPVLNDPSITPKCCDPLFGYGIGNCTGCHRWPVVLYRKAESFRWRCEACYRQENNVSPNNLVQR